MSEQAQCDACKQEETELCRECYEKMVKESLDWSKRQ